MISICVSTPWIDATKVQQCQSKLSPREVEFANALLYAQQRTSWDDRSSTITMKIGEAFNGAMMIILNKPATDDMSDIVIHDDIPEDDAIVCRIIDKLATMLPVQRM